MLPSRTKKPFEGGVEGEGRFLFITLGQVRLGYIEYWCGSRYMFSAEARHKAKLPLSK